MSCKANSEDNCKNCYIFPTNEQLLKLQPLIDLKYFNW